MLPPAERRPARPSPCDAPPRTALSRELASLERAREPGWITMAAPAVTAAHLFDAIATNPSVLWCPPRGSSAVGLDAVALVEEDPRTRGLEAAAIAASFRVAANAVRHVSLDGTDPPPLRVFGGLSFFSSPAASRAWRPFGRSLFLLPRALYRTDGARASVSVYHSPGEASGGAERARTAVRELFTAMDRAGARPPAPAAPRARIPETDRARWRALVREILSEIASGRLRKVVLSRCVRVAHPAAPDGLAGRLDLRREGAVLFGLRRGGATFLGASPERLVSVRGSEVASDALAGTTAPEGGPVAEREMLSNGKTREEHAHVVDAIRERLTGFCRSLDAPTTPRIVRLPHATHLHTPVAGRLSRPAHALDLALALHPTPAVGGAPARDALAWLARHEPDPRGWFAAPFGWFDAEGDGDFVVALRSGLVENRCALVYAGAGIVSGSDPDAEFDETSLKMTPLLEALGAVS